MMMKQTITHKKEFPFVSRLNIKNFKSIRHADFPCKRINIFIGEPNTGKSNILESLALFSIPYGMQKDIQEKSLMQNGIEANIDMTKFIRMGDIYSIFYNGDVRSPIEIISEEYELRLLYKADIFEMHGEDKAIDSFNFHFNIAESGQMHGRCLGFSPFKFYRFKALSDFQRKEAMFLLPPNGENLLTILRTNKEIRKFVSAMFSEFGQELILKPFENKIEILIKSDNVGIGFPYNTISDTLQRQIFNIVAIESNSTDLLIPLKDIETIDQSLKESMSYKNSIIILEEPEAHSFPTYIKYLAERIVRSHDQYFISTHNPYLLLPVIEKTPAAEIGIFIVYFKDGETKIKPLQQSELSDILEYDIDIFFNFAKFLE